MILKGVKYDFYVGILIKLNMIIEICIDIEVVFYIDKEYDIYYYFFFVLRN